MGHYVIIGGGGFLGAHIISALQKGGYHNTIIVVDPKPQKFETIIFDKQQVVYEQNSFLDPEILDELLPGAEAVFHLAAVGHTGASAGDKQYVFNFNVNGTKQLVDKCKQYGVKRFVYASSVAVSFIGKPLCNVNEDDPLPDPKKYLDHYSASKAEAERFVLSQSTNKFKTVCLRFRAIYGPEDPNVTHKVAKLIKNGLFIGMVSVHGRESMSMASSGVNCAKAFVLSDKMLKKSDGPHGRVYYIMDAERIGQYSFWTPLVLSLGKTPPNWYLPYIVLHAIVPIVQYFSYNVLRRAPLLTKFELLILATDNTYSIAKARQELGYVPDPCIMPDVAKYYQNLEEASTTSSVNWKIVMSIVILIISGALLFLFNFN